MSRYRIVSLLTLGGLAATVIVTAASSAERQPARAVIELFTSQGCSSCPTADRLLGELANDPSLVAISVPIDYWDYLGWKDTLAKPQHTARQRHYAHMRGDREVYTPQVVVNGVAHVLGSDRAAIERAIQRTRAQEGVLVVPVTLERAGDGVIVSLPASGVNGVRGEVWLCALVKQINVAIPRGENRGRAVSYHNVARRWVKLGEWNGAAQSRTIPLSDFNADGIDAVAVIVQSGSADKPGRMIGAAIASLD